MRAGLVGVGWGSFLTGSGAGVWSLLKVDYIRWDDLSWLVISNSRSIWVSVLGSNMHGRA